MRRFNAPLASDLVTAVCGMPAYSRCTDAAGALLKGQDLRSTARGSCELNSCIVRSLITTYMHGLLQDLSPSLLACGSSRFPNGAL